MPGAPNKDSSQNYGLTPREIDLIIKAMVTVVENDAKQIDFEKLARMTQYKNANAAAKNWYFTAQKLKAVGSNIEGEVSGDNKPGGEAGGDKAGGKKRGKRQAADASAAPPAKRGRVRKAEDDEEEQAFGGKAEVDEI